MKTVQFGLCCSNIYGHDGHFSLTESVLDQYDRPETIECVHTNT